MSTGLPQYAVGVESDVAKNKPRRGLALVLAFFVTGLGQAYLGYWRRAVLWATAPLLLDLAFTVSVLRFELRALYGWVLVVTASAWIAPRIAALWEVRSLPERSSGASGFAGLALFSFGTVFFAFALSAFDGACVATTSTTQSGAMRPTLLMGDRLLIDRMVYRSRPAKRGELVAFDAPNGPPDQVVKRVIGLPGDRLELTDQDLRINGWRVPHCVLGRIKLADSHVGQLRLEFLADGAYLTFWDQARDTPPVAWTVALGEVSLLGDNRNDGAVSRAGRKGNGIRSELLSGRPAFVFLGLKYDESVDWSRIGLALDRPQLPSGMEALDPLLRKCLAARPSRTQTEPPPPG